jgi:hypothetical protein
MSNTNTIATEFANRMTSKGINLDFTLSSLETEIDKIIEDIDNTIDDKDKISIIDRIGMEAYVGEVLLSFFKGTRQGKFDENNPGANFYLSSISFGDYAYYPSHFLSYRFLNGPAEGKFRDHLKNVLNKINSAVM